MPSPESQNPDRPPEAGASSPSSRPAACSHMENLRPVQPTSQGCQECLETGDTWVHLRLCLTCGHVGCCDDSKNRHATRHYLASGHPVIQSFEPGESWMWCYPDELFFE